MNRATRLVIKTVLLGAVICGPGAARATFEATPYVGYSFEHDDNVFRYEDRNEALAQSGNSKLSDTIEEAIVGGSVDYTIGRQRLFFEGAAYERRYDEFDELDFDGNWMEGGVDWEIGPSLSGEVSLDRSRSLRDFGAFLGERRRSVETRTDGSADANLRVLGSFVVSAGLGVERVRNSLAAAQDSDIDEDLVRFGVGYRGRSQWEFGVESVLTDGEYVERAPGTREYDQETHSLVAKWTQGGSSLNFGIGHTERDNETGGGEDFSGLTSSLSYDRKISPKTRVGLGVKRSVASVETQGENYAVYTGGNIRIEWDPRPQLGFALRLSRQNEDYRGSTLNQARREDDLTRIGLLADYEFARYFRLRPSLDWEDRSSNRQGQEYDSFRAGLELRLQFPIR